MLIKDVAICLRAVDYSETSQILTFFSRDNGKFAAIAKGSKRPKSKFDGPFEIFTLGRIVFADSQKQKLATVTEFEQSNSFSQLRKNLFSLNCAYLADELLCKLTEDFDPHVSLFDSLLQCLNNLSQAEKNSDILKFLICFQLDLLKQTGLEPLIDRCANCKKPFSAEWSETYFSSSANGLICRDCENSFTQKIKIKTTAAAALADFDNLRCANAETVVEIEKIIVKHFTYILNQQLKSAKYVLRL